MDPFFETKIEFLKGVGPTKASLLNQELAIYNFGDLLQHFPFRYEDRTKFYKIRDIAGTNAFIQLKGRITHLELIGHARKKRLVATFNDGENEIELVWFKGADWIQRKLRTGTDYVVFGKPNLFNRRYNIPHPEVDPVSASNEQQVFLQPVYPSTEKLRTHYLDSKGISKLQRNLLQAASLHIYENLPSSLIDRYRLMSKKDSLINIHFPKDPQSLKLAQFRLKFEELFYLQLRLIKLKLTRKEKFPGQVFNSTDILTDFYNNHLPFELTDAQKKVIKEIYRDLKSGKQMNRLIQGDVGSGKTIVSFLCMLVVIGNGAQATLMA